MAESSEFEVWYDAHDGNRRHLKATTQDDARGHIAYLRGQDDMRQQLAASIGLSIDPHEYGFEVQKVSVRTETVDLTVGA